MLWALESLVISTFLPLICLTVPTFLPLLYLAIPVLLPLLHRVVFALLLLFYLAVPIFLHPSTLVKFSDFSNSITDFLTNIFVNLFGNFTVNVFSNLAINPTLFFTMPLFFDLPILNWFLWDNFSILAANAFFTFSRDVPPNYLPGPSYLLLSFLLSFGNFTAFFVLNQDISPNYPPTPSYLFFPPFPLLGNSIIFLFLIKIFFSIISLALVRCFFFLFLVILPIIDRLDIILAYQL